jgi:hypothetical protein
LPASDGAPPGGAPRRRSAANWVALIIAWVALAIFVLFVLLLVLFSHSNLTF